MASSSFPPSLSSSAPPPSRVASAQQHPQHTTASFAFLVHSQDTIPRNLPPSVDNKPLARQRRRRTSPEDQAILEAEFQRDSKPDKDARRRIVERVALGEKEVQIWFQNRRQNKRRKAQPPLSYEILPHLEPAADDPPSSPADGFSDVSLSQGPSSGDEARSAIQTSPSTSAVSCKATPCGELRDDNIPAKPRSQPSASFPRPSINQSCTPSSSTMAQDAAGLDSTTPTTEHASSRVRLSMTSSGGAKIISGAESTPSPPRSQPLAPTPFATRQTLRRSYSAAGLRDSSHENRGHFTSQLGRLPSGRSRDSRAWEFWCDSDARNGLVKKAEQDTTGSAIDAISLIRSNSGRRGSGVLTPNINRTNLPVLARGESETKRLKKAHHDDWDVDICNAASTGRGRGNITRDTKLKRAMSSVARLQGADKCVHPSDDSDDISLSSRGESDKENREPDASRSANRRSGQRRVEGTARAVLGESRTVPAFGGNGHGGLGIRTDRPSKFGNYAHYALAAGTRHTPNNADEEADEEVAQFMRGGRGKGDNGPDEEDDDEMNCVAGLLSLSQGNWR